MGEEIPPFYWIEAHISQMIDRAHSSARKLDGKRWSETDRVWQEEVPFGQTNESSQVRAFTIVEASVIVIAQINPVHKAYNSLSVVNFRSIARKLITISAKAGARWLSEEVVEFCVWHGYYGLVFLTLLP